MLACYWPNYYDIPSSLFQTDMSEYKDSWERKTLWREHWIFVTWYLQKTVAATVYRQAKSRHYDFKCKRKLSTDICVTGWAETSSNSVTELGDGITIFEIKTTNKQKRQPNKLAIYWCKPASLTSIASLDKSCPPISTEVTESCRSLGPLIRAFLYSPDESLVISAATWTLITLFKLTLLP